jgi:AmmeMemoRadiSam system protein B
MTNKDENAQNKNILMAALMPHPPIMIPEIGKKEANKTIVSIDGAKKLCNQIVQAKPDTIVIVTPHSAFNPYFFTVHTGEKLPLSFARFGEHELSFEFDNDTEFIEELNDCSKKDFGRLNFLPAGSPLDHGSGVPLYFLANSGYKNKIVVINYTALGKREHNLFGKRIADTAKKRGRKIVFIASGDLSHRLIPGAPAGYDKDAHEFDDKIVRFIKDGNYDWIVNMPEQVRNTAGECGYNSLMVAFGVIGGKPVENEVISYEAPFGVGYLVAKL